MDWPANSPDLNPIEHLLDQLKRAVDKRIEEETTLDDSSALLQEEWNAIPERRIILLISSEKSCATSVGQKRRIHQVLIRRTNQ